MVVLPGNEFNEFTFQVHICLNLSAKPEIKSISIYNTIKLRSGNNKGVTNFSVMFMNGYYFFLQ